MSQRRVAYPIRAVAVIDVVAYVFCVDLAAAFVDPHERDGDAGLGFEVLGKGAEGVQVVLFTVLLQNIADNVKIASDEGRGRGCGVGSRQETQGTSWGREALRR